MITLRFCLKNHSFLALQEEIFNNLTKAAEANGHFKVYDHKNLPSQWHMQNKRRMGPILAVSDLKYAFHDMITTAEYYEKEYNISSKAWLSYTSQ